MFHDALIQNIFFRIINFIVFSIIGLILFKQKLLPAIKKRIQEKTLLLANLEQQKQGIKYQHNNMDNALEQQEHLAQDLIKKVMIWKEAVEHQEQTTHEIIRALQEKMEIKNALQREYQVINTLNEQILPEALDEVEQKLKDRFSHKDAGQEYIHDIIRFIKKDRDELR